MLPGQTVTELPPPATVPLTVVPPIELAIPDARPTPANPTSAPATTLPTSAEPADSSPKTLAGLEPTELEKLIDERLKVKLAEIEAKKKAETEKKAAEGFVVGDDLNMNVSWDWGGFRYKTADEAFSVHFGGRLMYDAVWWDQSPGLNRPATLLRTSPLFGRTGVGVGIGDLQDGFFIRRARVVGDGTIYQTVEFKVEFDFENLNSLAFDEMYVGMKDLPFVDAVRLGQVHVPFGLEAYTSSRWQPLMERSPLFDAFYQEFAPGIFLNETFLDQRITAQQMFHRIDNFAPFNGSSFGDGKYAFTTRVSGLPIYEAEGRYLMHLGASYQYRSGSTPADFNGGTTIVPPPPTVTENTDLVRFRSRASLRDAVGVEGDSSRVVDTGNIIAEHVQSVNFEYLAYAGSAWLQAEWCCSYVNDAVFPASPAGRRRGTLQFSGAYAMVGYFLTGEVRGYDKRFGRYDRVKPIEPFFLVRDENGDAACGMGAWELVYRFSYIDLNDDVMVGGRYGEHTFGVNWYWNSNVKLQLNYVNGQRSFPRGVNSGTVQGLGVRAVLEF
jgi:phosphate-selective porin OprO/OprP